MLWQQAMLLTLNQTRRPTFTKHKGLASFSLNTVKPHNPSQILISALYTLPLSALDCTHLHSWLFSISCIPIGYIYLLRLGAHSFLHNCTHSAPVDKHTSIPCTPSNSSFFNTQFKFPLSMMPSLITLFNENLGAMFSPKSLTEWKPRDPESFSKLGPKCAKKIHNVSSKISKYSRQLEGMVQVLRLIATCLNYFYAPPQNS